MKAWIHKHFDVLVVVIGLLSIFVGYSTLLAPQRPELGWGAYTLTITLLFVVSILKLEHQLVHANDFRKLDLKADVWGDAIKLLATSSNGEQVWATASVPNDPYYEERLIDLIMERRFQYIRVIACKAENHVAPALQERLPAEPGGTGRLDVEEYLAWYRKFYEAWREHRDDEAFRIAAMNRWYRVNRRLGRFFTLLHLPGPQTIEYLINKKKQQAVLAIVDARFPRIGTGVWVEDSDLVEGLWHNLELLAKDWPPAAVAAE